MKYVPNGPIDDIPALVKMMAWPRPGNKPLSNYLNQWWLNGRRIYAPFGINELMINLTQSMLNSLAGNWAIIIETTLIDMGK